MSSTENPNFNPLGPIGFFGATPVAQQSTTGNVAVAAVGSTNAVFRNTTFIGASGTAYTVGDIVVALKALGILAP